jgi:transposase-like protein
MTATATRDGRAPGEEWNESRRAELVQQIASARLTVDEACARHGLGAELVQDWLRGFRRSVVLAFDERLKRTLADQGADVALGAAEFSGTLEEISVIDWIQSVEVTRKSALIVISGHSRENHALENHASQSSGPESRIWCANGAIVDAESGPLRGEPALYRIVSFDRGRVWVEFCAARRERTVYASTPSLLLEAAHRKDEAARMWRQLGDERCAYRVSERVGPRAAGSSQAERRLLESFRQPSSLLQVFEQSALGDVETLTLLTQLSESRFITPDPSSTAVRASQGDTPSAAASSRTLAVAAAPPQPAPARRGLPGWLSSGWVWSGVAAAALVSAAAWSRGEPLAGSLEVAVAALRPTPAPHPAPEPPRYVVATTFEPADAAIWLDGQRIPSGALNTTFPHDGHAHELRAVAPGYAPAVVLFADTPPPRLIRLETLPVPPAATRIENAAPLEDTASVQSGVAPRGVKAPRVNARRTPRARRQERAPDTPSIQTIDADTPAIRVIP